MVWNCGVRVSGNVGGYDPEEPRTTGIVLQDDHEVWKYVSALAWIGASRVRSLKN